MIWNCNLFEQNKKPDSAPVWYEAGYGMWQYNSLSTFLFISNYDKLHSQVRDDISLL